MVEYKRIEPDSIDAAREVYEIFKTLIRGGAAKGQIINKEKGIYNSDLLMAPFPPEIKYAVVAYNEGNPVGVISCGNVSKGIITNDTMIVAPSTRGMGIGTNLESQLCGWLGFNIKETSYAGSSAAKFHINNKHTVAGKFKLTTKKSLMLDVIHVYDGAKITPPDENVLFQECEPIYASYEVEQFVNECIANPDERFNELRREVEIIKKLGAF